MVNHHLHECTSIPNQKKRGLHVRDLTKLYKSVFALRSWRRHKKSSSHESQFHNSHTFKEPADFKDPGKEKHRHKGDNMHGVGNYGSKGDGFRGNIPRTRSANSFKHRSMDTFFSSSVDPPAFSRTASSKVPSPTATPKPYFALRNASLRRRSVDTNEFLPETLSRSFRRSHGNNPIMFSNSTGMMKPPPIERQLECTLEELCYGCMKKIKITRDVLTESGQIVQEEEILSVKVKPGWKKGTKITFEGMGNERPGSYAADVTFMIAEKRHDLFRRDGDDLELAIEIPLVKALTGCTIPIPLLGGKELNWTMNDIIHPGYERIIEGQGMPNSKEQGSRGNLKVLFHITFPTELTEEKRAEAVRILGDSC